VTDQARVAARRMYAAFNDHNHTAALDILTPDFYSHPLATTGPQAIVESWKRFHDAYPKASVAIEDMVVEGDTVAVRLSVHGIPDQSPTMLEIYRIRDGRIAELWALSSLRRDA
jgi:predicted SnoaL-like aldol condensation-catalyzing enzyme